jgi:hypothetical protein
VAGGERAGDLGVGGLHSDVLYRLG